MKWQSGELGSAFIFEPLPVVLSSVPGVLSRWVSAGAAGRLTNVAGLQGFWGLESDQRAYSSPGVIGFFAL